MEVFIINSILLLLGKQSKALYRINILETKKKCLKKKLKITSWWNQNDMFPEEGSSDVGFEKWEITCFEVGEIPEWK